MVVNVIQAATYRVCLAFTYGKKINSVAYPHEKRMHCVIIESLQEVYRKVQGGSSGKSGHKEGTHPEVKASLS